MPDANGITYWKDQQFRPFYTSQFVRDTWKRPCWTVSTPEKMPIDMYSFEHLHKIWGAMSPESPALYTLKEVCNLIPNAVNNCMYLDVLLDGYVVLDIEPSCPDDVRNSLMEMPYVYAETSMSGKGLHLVFPVPKDIFDKYPIAQAKTVMKEEHGWYEILLNHYITFTRNAVQPHANPNGTGCFRDLFESMCAVQQEVLKANIDLDELEPEDIPKYDTIMDLLLRQEYRKTPADFENDISKYEFGMMGFLRVKLENILNVQWIKSDHEYTDSEKAWMMFMAAREKLAHRAKHDTNRNGFPWLLWMAGDCIAKSVGQEQQNKAKKSAKKQSRKS